MTGGLSEEALARLMSCPNCDSPDVEIMVRESSLGAAVGPLGFDAVSRLKARRRMRCLACGHEWTRPPMVEMIRRATDDVADRLRQAEQRNQSLRDGLAGTDKQPGRARPDSNARPSSDESAGRGDH